MEESIEFAAGSIKCLLLGLGDTRPEQRAAIFLNHVANQDIDGQAHEVWISVTALNHRTTRLPKLVTVAVESGF